MPEEIKYHPILQRQINKFLPETYLQDEKITFFLELINNQYNNADLDKSFADHAFFISEREYEQILKEQQETNFNLSNSIKQLKKIITDLEPDQYLFLNPHSDNIDELIDVLQNIVTKSMHNEQNMKIVADSTNNFIIRTDIQGKITWLNKAFENFTGYTLEEVRGKTPGSFLVGAETDPTISKMFRAAINSIKPLNVRVKNYTKGGILYECDVQLNPIIDKRNNHIGFVSIQQIDMGTNILTSRLADANEDLVYQKKLYEEILDNIPIEMALVDKEKRYRFVNKSSIKNDAIRKWIIGKTDLEYVRERNRPEELGKLRMSNLEKIMLGDSTPEWIEEQILPDGSTKFIQRKYHMEPGSEYIIGYGLDVTKISKYTKELEGKNEELQISEKKLAEKNNELIKLNRDLDNFVYSTSHNLRSPITSIKGIVNILSDVELTQKENQFFLQQIIETADKLENTILDIIEYSKNSKTDNTISLIDIEKLARQAFSDNKYYFKDPIDFILECDINAPFYSDTNRITSILYNIISNAIKYSDNNKLERYLKMSIQINEENCVIEFKDNGIGMSEKTRLQAFKMFYRGSNQASGTGLGLFMVKEMLDMVAGQINLSSTLGEGTIIVLTLKNFDKWN